MLMLSLCVVAVIASVVFEFEMLVVEHAILNAINTLPTNKTTTTTTAMKNAITFFHRGHRCLTSSSNVIWISHNKFSISDFVLI